MIAESCRISSSRGLAGLWLRLAFRGLAACFLLRPLCYSGQVCGGEAAADICSEHCAFFGSATGGESEYEPRGAGLEDLIEFSESGQ